jgi:hypothetical protein
MGYDYNTHVLTSGDEIHNIDGRTVSPKELSDYIQKKRNWSGYGYVDTGLGRHPDDWEKEFGVGSKNHIRILNATDSDLTLKRTKDWSGSLYKKSSFPQVIKPGQWCGVFHVKTLDSFCGSEGAVVFRSEKWQEDIVLAWDCPHKLLGVLHSYESRFVEVRAKGHYNDKHLDVVKDLMEKRGTTEDPSTGRFYRWCEDSGTAIKARSCEAERFVISMVDNPTVNTNPETFTD